MKKKEFDRKANELYILAIKIQDLSKNFFYRRSQDEEINRAILLERIKELYDGVKNLCFFCIDLQNSR